MSYKQYSLLLTFIAVFLNLHIAGGMHAHARGRVRFSMLTKEPPEPTLPRRYLSKRRRQARAGKGSARQGWSSRKSSRAFLKSET